MECNFPQGFSSQVFKQLDKKNTEMRNTAAAAAAAAA
jgi:hypothetical protein